MKVIPNMPAADPDVDPRYLIRALAEIRGFLAPFRLTVGAPGGAPVAVPPELKPLADEVRAAGLDVVEIKP